MSSTLNTPSSFQTAAPVTPPETSPLPKEYGVTRLALMPRDPLWMHAYWEVAPYTWDEVKRNFGESVSQGRTVLRLHAEHGSEKKSFDVDVNIAARSWYVAAPQTDGEWHAELGLVLPDGRFVLLAISNRMRLPAGRVSELTDERWGVLRSEWERLYELSGGGRLPSANSFEILKYSLHALQNWEHLGGLSSSGRWPGALPGSSWGKAPERQKGFWLVADCEVTVYGATEPDARVLFQGRSIRLNPDGTFTFSFPLPDGRQDFPIHATNADGDLSRSIEFRVSRETHGSAHE